MSYPIGGEEANVVYMAESVYGVLPAAPRTWLWIGVIDSVEPSLDPSLLKLRGAGSRYVAYLKQGLRKVDLKLSYLYQDKGFLNAIMQGLPVGSGMPLSVEVFWNKITDGTVQVSLVHTGFLQDQVSISGKVVSGEDTEVMVAVQGMAQDVDLRTTHPTGTNNYPAPPVTAPKLTSDCSIEIPTASPLEVFSEFNLTIKNNLKRHAVIRSTNGKLLKWLVGRGFEVELDLTGFLLNVDFLAGLKADWSGEITIRIGTDVYTLSGCSYDATSIPGKVQSETPEKVKFVAKSLAIT
jgi:hypothetical protein